jgi:F-type H+-transporting ATPase subunit b
LRDLTVHRRFFGRILQFVVLAVLAAGVAVAPRLLAAQSSTPAAQAQPAAQTADASKPEAADSQEDQDKVFRLEGPIVKATAKALNLPITTTATIYDFINFAIIALAIGIPLFRFLPKFIRQRGEKVREDIESARKVTEDANSRLSAVEAKLSSIGEEIAKFRAEVEREIGQDEARIKSALEEESARIVAGAEQEIGAAATQARRGLRNFAAELAIEHAGKQLVLTPETDQALIAEFVADVTRNGASKGGQN